VPKPIRVVLADDHPIFRKGLREVLDDDDELEVVAECGDGDAALEAIVRERPAVAVLDIDMPKMDGLAIARALAEKGLATKVVLLTMHGREDLLRAAFDLGVAAYVVKDGAVLDVVHAIREVIAGRPFISSSLSATLLTQGDVRDASSATPKSGHAPLASHRPHAKGDSGAGPLAETGSAEPPGLSRLTPAERRVLALIADFKTSKEIAEALGIHYRTVENHRTSIVGKLGLTGSHALTRFAAEHRDRLK
jgi:DNA-binding NarL/FixJ family response regulator